MLESLDNALQITVLLVCVGVALYRANALQNRTWTVAFFFFVSYALADIYWLVSLIFYDRTPQISVVSDLCWYASYIFLYLLLRCTAPPEKWEKPSLLPWLGPVLAVGMAVYFYSMYVDWNLRLGEQHVLWEKALTNLNYAVLMSLLMFSSLRRLTEGQRYRKQWFLAILILTFCLLEYILWTVSCFEWEDTLANPYNWFDFLLTVCILLILPATKRAEAV